MEYIIDDLIQKLSTPVEELQLGKRDWRKLKHASLYTLAEVLLAGKPFLISARNIGTLTADRIWAAAACHLELPEDLLAEAAPSQAEAILDVWAAPLSALDLPLGRLSILNTMGLYRIHDLVQARSTDYRKCLGMRLKEVDEITRALSLYMVRAAQARLADYGIQAAIHKPQVEEPSAIPVPDLSLPLPKMSERDWAVLEYRAMQLSTLEQTRVKFDLKEKELRRILGAAHLQLDHKLIFLSLFLDHYETKAQAFVQELQGEPLDLKTPILHLLSEPVQPDLAADEEKLEKLVILLRNMVLQSSPWFKEHMLRRWPSLILLSSLVRPAIRKHAPVSQLLRIQERGRKDKTYRELACLVLAQAGKPMHFSAIAEEAGKRDSRPPLNAQRMNQTLRAHKELFVRVRRGEYALVEWKVQPDEYYPEIIASVLRQANRPMPSHWIHTRVSAIRPIKSSSLMLYLSLDVRFYRSLMKTYGLRGWLTAAAGQSDPIPDWLIEDPKSRQRLERARVKGNEVG